MEEPRCKKSRTDISDSEQAKLLRDVVKSKWAKSSAETEDSVRVSPKAED